MYVRVYVLMYDYIYVLFQAVAGARTYDTNYHPATLTILPCMYIHTYIHTYIHICVCVCVCGERQRDRQTGRETISLSPLHVTLANILNVPIDAPYMWYQNEKQIGRVKVKGGETRFDSSPPLLGEEASV